MMRVKKIVAFLLVVCMMITIVPQYNETTYAAIPNLSTESEWKSNVIKTPVHNQLLAAGHIDISWYNVSTLGEVSKYKIYIDNKLEKTVDVTTDEVMIYDYYTTKVIGHTLYIVAQLKNGKYISSNKIKFYVSKKGLGLSTNMGRALTPSDLKMSWYYNWGNKLFADEKYSNLEYVPMLWGDSGVNVNTALLRAIKNKGYKYVLAFNEPESWIDQSKVTVDKAIETWPTFMNSGLIVGSPATALCPPWSSQGKNTDWFGPFMKKLEEKNFDVDFIAMHYYSDYAGEAGGKYFLELVDQTYEMYHKPIWVTEFAIGGKNPFSGTDQNAKNQVYAFAKVVLEGLNSRDYVERYAWFTFNSTDTQHGASALYPHATGVLTDLGKLYRDMGNPGEPIEGPFQQEPTTKKPISVTVKKPAKTKVKSAKSLKAGQVKVSLKKAKNARKYQVKYSTSRKFSKAKTKNVKKIKFTLKGLKKGRKYYIKARSCNYNSKKTVYSSWSKAKKVTVKKK